MTIDPDADMISFTGSTAIDRAAIAAGAATLKKVSMELGGKNPQIIFPDADMDAAVDAATFGAYFNAGECCNAGSRPLLHVRVADRFLSELTDRAKTVKGRDPLDPDTRVGAIISADHLGKIEGHLKAARENGAELRVGGARLESDDLFMAPMIVERISTSMAMRARKCLGRWLSRSLSKLCTRPSNWRIRPPMAFRQASGVATSTPQSASGAVFAWARSGSTPSWTERRSCRSADIGSLASAATRPKRNLKTTPEKRCSTFTPALGRLVAPARSTADLENREPFSGFWIRRRTVFRRKKRTGRGRQ
jgi:hypothetical protein